MNLATDVDGTPTMTWGAGYIQILGKWRIAGELAAIAHHSSPTMVKCVDSFVSYEDRTGSELSRLLRIHMLQDAHHWKVPRRPTTF